MIEKMRQHFREPTPLEMAAKELSLAYLSKLEAETAVDYAKSIVDYNNSRIKRLEAYLEEKSQYSKERT